MSTQNTKTEITNRKTRSENANLGDILPSKTIRIGKLKEDKKYKALKKSIEAQGVITPVVVRKNEDETYTIIDGNRRYLAATELGHKDLKVIIYEDIENLEDVLCLVSNTNQKALTPIELGLAYKRLIDNGIYATNRELAKALGLSEGSVGTKIKNLEMDKRIIKDLLEGYGINDQKVLKAIRTLEKVNDDNESQKQWEAYSHIVEDELKRDAALEYLKSLKDSEIVSERTVRLSESNVIDLHIDTSTLDENKKRRIQELVAEIKALQQEEAVAA